MITNLEGKGLTESLVKKFTDKLARTTSVMEAKFNDAFQKITNMRSSISATLGEIDYEGETADCIQMIQTAKALDDTITNEFLGSVFNTSDLMALATKYSDNRLRLANRATNGMYDSDSIGDASSYFEDGTNTIDGTQFQSTKAVRNDSFNKLSGVNAIVDGKPNMAVGIKSEPGHNRSLFINVYNSSDITSAAELEKKIPFSTNSDPVKYNNGNITNSTPFVVIRRQNKINSFDFGIQYVTKNETIKLYVKNSDGSASVVDTGFYNTGNGAMVKRFFGSFIIVDNGVSLETSYILNNSEESLFEGDLPKFKFSFAYDNQFIYMYLENFEPYRLTYQNVMSMQNAFTIGEGTAFGNAFVRDILEVMQNSNYEMTNEDSILSIQNKYGVNVTPTGLRDLQSTLGIFKGSAAEGLTDLTQNIYFIPNFMINLSLKDNSFFSEDSFIVGSIFSDTDILTLDKVSMEIKTNTKSLNTQVQLFNIPLTDGNNIKLLSDTVEDKFVITNVGFDSVTERLIKSKTISQIVSENNDFIKSRMIDGKPIFYHSKLYINTVVNPVTKMVDTDSIPDYVVDEIGEFRLENGTIYVNCKSHIFYKYINELATPINSAKDLVDRFNNPSIALKIFENIDQGGNVNNVVIDNVIPIEFNNIGQEGLRNTLPILSTNSSFNVNENLFKGLIRVETTILPDSYEFDGLTVKHISMADPVGSFGYLEDAIHNQSLENQAIMSGQNIAYFAITMNDFDNFTVFPSPFSAIEGSTVTFTVYPARGYFANSVKVNGVDVPLSTNNKFTITNIDSSIDIVVDVQPIPIQKFTMYIDSITNGSISPSATAVVDAGSTIQYNVTPVDGYYVTTVLVNSIPVSVNVDNSFIISNIQEDKHIYINCTLIPPKFYNITVETSLNGTTNPVPGTYQVQEGTDFVITNTPDAGYMIQEFDLDGFQVDSSSSNSYTISDIQGDHLFRSSFMKIPPKQFHATVLQSTYCTVSPSGSTIILEGENQQFTITPNPGYMIQQIMLDGVDITSSLDSSNSFIISNCIADHTISAVCIVIPLKIFQVNCVTTPGCTLSSTGHVNVTQGTDFTITVTPEIGHYISHIIVDGGLPQSTGLNTRVSANYQYKFTDVQGNHSFQAVSELIDIDINVVEADNCTVVPSTTTVKYGGSASFDVAPTAGYAISMIIVNGVQIANSTTFEISNITSSTTISVVCSVVYHTITLQSDGNCSIVGNTTVSETSSQNYTVTPKAGFTVTHITVNGIPVPITSTVTLTNILGDCTIIASAVPSFYNITITKDPLVSVTGNTTVALGSSANFNFSADPSYDITDVKVDGVSVGDITSVSLDNVVANHTIQIIGTVRSYTITLDQSTVHGSVSASLTTVTYGGSSLITITPATGYQVDTVTIDGVPVSGSPTSYYLNNVAANHTVSATFKLQQFTISTNIVNGTFNENNPVINYGGNITLNISPINSHYRINSVIVDGVDVGYRTSVTLTNIREAHSVQVVCDIIQRIIHITQPSNGAITPSGDVSGNLTINDGSNQTFLISADPGYTITKLTINGIDVSANSSYIFSNVTSDQTISATIVQSNYVINVTNDGSTVVSNNNGGSNTIQLNGSVSYTFTPATGYNITHVVIDGVDKGAITTFDFNGVVANHTIDIHGSLINYAIAITNGLNGTATPTGNQPVAYGGNLTVGFSPATGYQIDTVSIDGTNAGAIASYTFNNVTANHTVSVTYKPIQFTVSTSIDNNGAITPSTVVNYGSTFSVTITPAAHYKITSVMVDGASQTVVPGGMVLSFNNVQANHTVIVSTALITHNIVATNGTHNTITPSGSNVVGDGGSVSFTITPDSGYYITGLVIDGATIAGSNSFTFSGVVADHTITATAELIPPSYYQFTVVTDPQVNVVSSTGSFTIARNANATFTITPNASYTITDVVVDGTSRGVIGSYTFNNVTAVHDILVIGSINTYNFTVSAGTNGSITPSTVSPVQYGSNQSFTVKPNVGYQILNLLVDNNPIAGAVGSKSDYVYTFNNVSTNHTISATFTKIPVVISTNIDNSGTITGPANVYYGDSPTYTITPAAHMKITSITVDGVPQTIVNALGMTITLNNVIQAHSIVVNTVIITHSITVVAGTNCTISPTTVTVNDGDNQAFTITPNSGYTIVGINIDNAGQTVYSSTSYTFTNVTADHSITAYAVPSSYLFSLTNDPQVTITNSNGNNNTIPLASNVTYNFSASAGYSITDVIIDGTTHLGAVTSYIFSNVTAIHSIRVVGAINTYTLTPLAGANGAISPNTASVVQYGASQTFTFTPNTGYQIDAVSLDGTVVANGVTSYILNNIQANHTVSVTFKKIQFTVTGSVTNGTITPTSTVVNYGDNINVTITPNAHYKVSTLTVGGTTINIGDANLSINNSTGVWTYTLNSIQANQTVVAGCTIITHSITASSGSNCTVSPSGANTVNDGSNQTFTVTPSANYSVIAYVIDGVQQAITPSSTAVNYTFSNVTVDHTFSAIAVPSFYQQTITNDAQVTVTSSTGSSNLALGSNATFTIAVAAGYTISKITLDGVDIGNVVGPIQLNNVTAIHAIVITGAVNKYNIVASTDANGTITPSGTTQVSYGNSQTYNFTPNTGYQIDTVTVDGNGVGNGGSYTFNNVQATHTISVTYKKIQYTVTIGITNGTTNPGTSVVNYGDNLSINITPTLNYQITSVTVGGVSQTITNALGMTLTLTNITAAKTVSVTCSIIKRNITITQPTNGSITPAGTANVLQVDSGSNQAFTITPNSGYYIVSLTINGSGVAAASSYTFTNITADCTITATIAIIPPTIYTITSQNSANNTVSPYGAQSVTQGTSSPTFTFTPAAGYYISAIQVDGVNVSTWATPPGSTGVAQSYTLTNVQANHTVSAISTAIPSYSITVTCNPSTSAFVTPPSTQSVLYGNNVSFTFTPATGYQIASVVVDGVNVGTPTSYTFNTVTANHTLVVTMSLVQYSLTVTQAANCTITPGTTQVTLNNSTVFTATPAAGYRVVAFVINGTAYNTDGGTGAKQYTLVNSLAQNYTVTVTVTQITYTVNFTTPTNVSVTGNTYPQTITIGGGVNFTLVRSSGYQIGSIVVNGTTITLDGAQNTLAGGSKVAFTLVTGALAITNLNENLSITVNMVVLNYTLTVVAIANVTYQVTYGGNNYTPGGTDTAYTIQDGTSITITSTIATGYTNGGSYKGVYPGNLQQTLLGTNSSYTFTISGNMSYETLANILTYGITATQPANGVIAPSGVTTVNYNTNRAYTVTPNSTYSVSKVTVDGVDYTAAGSYLSGALTISIASGVWTVTFVGVKATHTITATMITVANYNLTLTVATGYNFTIGGTTYTNTTTLSVTSGSDVTVVVGITTGYVYRDLVLNGVNIYPKSTILLKNITANTSLSVVTIATPDQRIYSPLVTYKNPSAPAYSASTSYNPGVIVTYNYNGATTWLLVKWAVPAGTAPNGDYSIWVVYDGDVILKNDGGTSWGVYRLNAAQAQVPYGTLITNTTYYTKLGTLSGQGGTTTTPPMWSNTDQYSSGAYIMFMDQYNNYHVAKVQWWTQGDNPTLNSANTVSGVFSPGDIVNPISLVWNSTSTYITNDTVIRNNAIFVAQTSVAANVDPATNSGASGSPWRFQEFVSADLAWVTGKTYHVGDYSVFAGKLYKSNTLHTSDGANEPDVDSALDTSKTWTWVATLS